MFRLPRRTTRFREAKPLRPPARGLSQREGQMPRKSVSGFSEAGAAMAQQLDDNDLLNLFSAIGRIVSKRFLLKRPWLDRWQLVVDYLTSAMAFAPREQFRVLYLDKRNNLIADEVLAEGTVDHTPVYPREVLRRAIELHATGCVLVHNHPSGDATPSRADIDMTKQVQPGGSLAIWEKSLGLEHPCRNVAKQSCLALQGPRSLR